MTLRLYNTLTRTKEEFSPIDPNNVRMYVCGPTVYDFAHIGNARPVIVFDVLFRLLRHLYGESHVKYVRNITDVDDKINARALRDFPNLPLNEAIRLVTEKTANQFQSDAAALGCLVPTEEPRATDNIQGMIDIISTLINKSHAYTAAGEVLFSVSSMADYGKLSGRKLEEQQAGARVAVEAHKKNPADFVLWKLSSADEPGWESPWGRGRPGWHIECSAMSKRYLGEVFDIHGGGLDLIFPHHENEIAQSRCAHGSEVMANVWMHNGFLQVEGQKMSKSLGNFYTIDDLLETNSFGSKRWDGEVLRLAMLMTHYTQPIDWTTTLLEECEVALTKMRRSVAGMINNNQIGSPPSALIEKLCDDLNTPDAIKLLHELSEQSRSNSSAESLFNAMHFLGILPTGKADLETLEALPETAFEIDTEAVADEELEESEQLGNVETPQPQIAQPKNLFIRFLSDNFFPSANSVNLSASFSNALPTLIENPKFKNKESVLHIMGPESQAVKRFSNTDVRVSDLRLANQKITIEDLNQKIVDRLGARAEKNWKESDRIRDELDALGVTIKDNKDGTTTWEVKR
jgi:cysteinyl-tRNA synthetase